MKTRPLPLVALLLACNPTIEQAAPGGGQSSVGAKAMPPILQGRYREVWGEQAEQRSEHRFDEHGWDRDEGGQYPGRDRLDLLGQRAAGQGFWQLRFRYAKRAALRGQELRIDLYRSAPSLLWMCIHPSTSTQVEGLEASSANPQDLEGRGCYGRPWRRLEKAS